MASSGNIGDDIRKAVQDAIDSQDFNELAGNIGNALNIAGENIRKGLEQAAAAAQESQRAKASATEEAKRRADARNELLRREAQQYAIQQTRYARTGGKQAGAFVTAAFGVGALAVSGSALGVGLATGAALPLVIGAGVAIAVFGALTGFGAARFSLISHFNKFKKIIGVREACGLGQISQMTGIPESSVLKDIRKMLKEGFFTQGHLTDDDKTIILTNEAYSNYRLLEDAETQRKREEELAAKAEAEREAALNLDRQEREIIQRGEAYVAEIRQLNEEIPDEVVTEKVDRIELVTGNILARAKEHPEVVGDLEKLMDYYLPITVKLLTAYRDLDAEPIQGENIKTSKQEIVKTLDTLNDALEKLLDSIFREAAWDVSSDVAVLHAVLAQEGLIGDAFGDARRKRMTEAEGAGETTTIEKIDTIISSATEDGLND